MYPRHMISLPRTFGNVPVWGAWKMGVLAGFSYCLRRSGQDNVTGRKMFKIWRQHAKLGLDINMVISKSRDEFLASGTFSTTTDRLLRETASFIHKYRIRTNF